MQNENLKEDHTELFKAIWGWGGWSEMDVAL